MKFLPLFDWLTCSSSAEVTKVSDYLVEDPLSESQDSRPERFLSQLPWLLLEPPISFLPAKSCGYPTILNCRCTTASLAHSRMIANGTKGPAQRSILGRRNTAQVRGSIGKS
jgi:hypothetical protein